MKRHSIKPVIMFTSFNNSIASIYMILTSCLLSMLMRSSISIPLDSYNHPTDHNQFDQVSHRKSQTNQQGRLVESHMMIRKIGLSSNNNVTCNDGSQAGYYMRLNSQSTSWVVYLQGGGLCDSEESCRQRWLTNPHLMSSNFWSKTKKGEGILSDDPKENPHLWNANHIFVPYCSSDSWTGLSSASQQETGENTGSSFTFMGSKIIEQVFDSLHDDLPQDSSLFQAKYILLAGDSAGALGVLLNLDRINELVQRRAQSMSINCSTFKDQIICKSRQPPVVAGLADSGWFLDNEPYDFGNERSISFGERDIYGGTLECEGYRCTPLQSMREAIRFWNGQIPSACAEQYSTEPWRCYFGYHAYKTLKTPIFIVQWLYDEAQLLVDNVARPSSADQWTYVNKVANEMRASLENVTALFAPSCLSHSLISKSIWNLISIDGFKLPQILNDWEEQIMTLEAMQQLQKTNQLAMYPDDVTQARQQDQDKSFQVYTSPFSFSNQEPQSNVDRQREYIQQHTQSSLEQRAPSNKQQQQSTGNVNPNRTRTRKRKRNNQQQRNKQIRPKSSLSASNYHTSAAVQTQSLSREPNEVISTFNPLEDLLPLIDSSMIAQDTLAQRNSRQPNNITPNNGRASRSAIVDDASSVLSNNMQDDSLSIHSTSRNLEPRLDSRWTWPETFRNQAITIGDSSSLFTKQIRANQFRLIDSCGWLQCNRDCPNSGSETSLGAI